MECFPLGKECPSLPSLIMRVQATGGLLGQGFLRLSELRFGSQEKPARSWAF